MGELVPWPAHARQPQRAQAGMGRLELLGAAHLGQQQPGAVRVHLHQVKEDTGKQQEERQEAKGGGW